MTVPQTQNLRESKLFEDDAEAAAAAAVGAGHDMLQTQKTQKIRESLLEFGEDAEAAAAAAAAEVGHGALDEGTGAEAAAEGEDIRIEDLEEEEESGGSHVEYLEGAQLILHDGSEVVRRGAGTWVITVPTGCTTADVNYLTDHMPPGAVLKFRGDPDAGGLCVFAMEGTKAEVEEEVRTHKWPSPPVIETDKAWRVIPELDVRDDSDGNPGLAEVDSNRQGSSTSLWGLDRVDARRGLDDTYSPPSDGSGVHVYVADTGIRTTHQDFGGRAVPTLEVISSVRKVCDASDTDCAADGHGHGTHCAGTVGGRIYGVAKKSSLHAVKVLSDSGEGDFSWTIEALDWVMVSGTRPAVFSASLGGWGVYSTLRVAIDNAVSRGVSVVVAAGNDGSTSFPDACKYSPAYVASAITVGSTDSRDARSHFSSYGSCLDIFAPGSDIKSAGHWSDTATMWMSGTSMACPHVAGAVALLFAEDKTLTPAQALQILIARATPDAITDAQTGSPNLLLYTGLDTVPPTSAPMPTPGPPPVRMPGFRYVGPGYCSAGYYAGGNAADAADLATCAAKCASEPYCRYFALRPKETCSRYDAQAGDCLQRPLGRDDHEAWARVVTLPGFDRLGPGYCSSGYYAGGNAADAVDLATCAAKCASEPHCRYFALRPKETCSRYDAQAGDCLQRPLGRDDHEAWARVVTLPGFDRLGLGYCSSGYYAGGNAADAADLATCAAKCASEPHCRYFALKPKNTCSRYNSKAGDCLNRPQGRSDHETFKKA